MKIKTKLGIGYAMLLLLFAGVTSFGYLQLGHMSRSMDHFYENRFEKVQIALSLRGEVNASGRLMNDIMIGELNPERAVEDISRRLESAERQYRTLANMSLGAAELDLISRIDQLTASYGSSVRAFVDNVGQGKIEEAKALYAGSLRNQQRDVIDNVDVLVSVQENALKEEMADAKETYNWSVSMVALLTVIGLLLGLGVVMWVFPSINQGLNLLGRMADRFARGRLGSFSRIEVKSKDELGELAQIFKQIALDLQEKNEREERGAAVKKRQARVNEQLAQVTELLQEGTDMSNVAQAFISEFAPVLGAAHGLIYLSDPSREDAAMQLAGSYAMMKDCEVEGVRVPTVIRSAEGLAGQCLRDAKPIALDEVPSGYFKIGSGLGAIAPGSLIVQPILYDGAVLGVLELATLTAFNAENRELLEALCEKLGTILNNMRSRQRVEELLKESQAMTEELQVQSEELVCQQEELRETNDKLERQQSELLRSEERLQQQQEELEYANKELTDKTQALEQHVVRMEQQNKQIAKANEELERQALQLALTSKYKSEFLANMSHELRTPLNSLLILSEFLAENKEGNLTEKQREYMRTIHLSGNDLLKMIDEILDLSKIDAGKMDIHPEWTVLEELLAFLDHLYMPLAESKRLALHIVREDDIPDSIRTDGHRLKQIMRNLLSNALKFTDEGTVTLTMRRPHPHEMDAARSLEGADYIALAVADTGIGIARDKSERIFEAFRQADGTTSRKYGGTGLGLTISRELAHLLGGWIHLESEPGKGSLFTLILPEHLADPQTEGDAEGEAYAEPLAAGFAADYAAAAAELLSAAESETRLEDDRESLQPDDKVLLVIEDDTSFAKVLLEMARARGFKAIVETQGDAGLKAAKSIKPDAILLDIQLPVTDGWSILNALKSDPATRHIPVHVISVTEQSSHGLRMGAIDHLQKPATAEQLEHAFESIGNVLERKPKRLLLVERDEEARRSLSELIVHDDVRVVAVGDADSAWERLQAETFDCIVLDSGLPDGAGVELLKRMRQSTELLKIPVIVHSEGKDDEATLRKMKFYADPLVLKNVKSPERLLEETTLFLHRVEADLPEDKRKLLSKLHQREEAFEGKTILLVDDDVRNVFALSGVLEHRGMKVLYAENGREALAKLDAEPDIDLVLMDIMMPEMDGYEAMRRIRGNPERSQLPVIALTAKAMKDDRNKCIEAGASDYITKPVNTDQLLSLMRVWLYR